MLIQPLRTVGKAVVNSERTRWREDARDALVAVQGAHIDPAEVDRHLRISFSVWLRPGAELDAWIEEALKMNATPSFFVSSFVNAKHTEVYPEQILWSELCTRLAQFEAPKDGKKTDLPAWSPVRYREGSRRGSANVKEVSCIVLDIDSEKRPVSIEEACKPWQGVAHCVHTSWSHTVERPKFRVVIPLAQPVEVGLWPRVWNWAQLRAKVEVDAKCKDPARIYFVPALRDADAPHEAFVSDGPMLVLPEEAFLPTPEERRRQKLKEMDRIKPRGMTERPRRAELVSISPTEREALGLRLGGRVDDRQVVRDVVCPGCGRPSLFWPVYPTGTRMAMCRHRGTCGRLVSLEKLNEGM